MTSTRFILFGAFLALQLQGQGPVVDVAWKVLPRRVAADTFGSRVAKLYYAIAVVVGNNSGRDLEVSSILFQLPASSGITTPVPSEPHTVVRGSLVREHEVGLRNTTVNIMRGAGPILVGGATLFSGSLQYNRLVNVITNPVEKSLELIFPDRTVTQMAALDSLTLRDEVIVTNGKQRVLLVFMSRGLLGKTGAIDTWAGRMKSEFDPVVVMKALGELVLTGKQIQYLGSIQVVK